MKKLTREEWLNIAVDKLRDGLFKKHNYVVPQVKVSVGFAHGKKKAVGQHWSPEAAKDKIGQIFISPVEEEVGEILGTLVHELVHAAVGNKEKHGPVFRKCALAVGLEGKMREAGPGKELFVELRKMAKEIGAFPHSQLIPGQGPVKKQTTRMIKMECLSCQYIARASLTTILDVGPVICPCNDEHMHFELPEG